MATLQAFRGAGATERAGGRQLSAPRVPIRISRERLAEIETEAMAVTAPMVMVDIGNAISCQLRHSDMRQSWYRHSLRWENGRWEHYTDGPHPTLRAALEAPVVRRAGCPPVQEFEVES